MNNKTIRKATIGDASRIADIHIRGWQTAYKHIFPIEKLDSLRLSQYEEAWKERLQNQQLLVFIAEDQGIPRGFIAFGPYRGDDLNKGEIYAVYIDPDSTGKGYGALLCQTACEHLRNQGYSNVILWTLEENYNAHRFYETIGFCKTSEIKQVNLLGVPLQEIQYKKELTK